MNATQEVKASDRARAVAGELGVDLVDVKGTGKDGSITVTDVRGAAPSAEWATRGYSGPQPWELDRDEDLAPLIHHSHPMLSSGSGGPEVAELAELLEDLGYETSVSKGENPFFILDPTIMAAVQRFCAEYGVLEDPSGFPPGEASNYVGPWTWEALHRAAAD